MTRESLSASIQFLQEKEMAGYNIDTMSVLAWPSVFFVENCPTSHIVYSR
jgi:F420-dependent methylenetetrahydromethanopterin dehydrogenase